MDSRLFLISCLIGTTIGTIMLGLQGFSDDGMPFSSERRLSGTPGKIAGVFCFLIAACFAGSTIMVALKYW